MKKMLRVRFVMTLMFAAAGISASRDARATTTCIDPSQDIYTPFNAGDGGSNPNVEYCTLAYVLNSGTGAALLTQDIGSANSSAYALKSTSINNDGIIGTTAGGNGAAGVLGTNTGSGGIGVYGQTAAGYAFYGEDTSTGTGVYGTSPTAVATGFTARAKVLQAARLAFMGTTRQQGESAFPAIQSLAPESTVPTLLPAPGSTVPPQQGSEWRAILPESVFMGSPREQPALPWACTVGLTAWDAP
jgi:hypothetical protein